MQMVPGLGGAEIGLKVWRKLVAAGPAAVSVAWFTHRFTIAAMLVADRWGPIWAKRRIAGRGSIGAWALLVLWLGFPILILSRLW
jgi:hypothetical protein